jgi:3-hydroxyisobutyrate dehydrogenase
MSRSLAFVGMGIMGAPMAGHLLAAGHRLAVSTRTRAKAQPLLDRGARWCENPADAAGNADVVFLCVTDTPDVRDVILGPRGIIRTARSGLIVVDHSTISPKATREMGQELAEPGAMLLDAPVSGGDVGARNATLSIMVGGNAGAFEQVRPLLAHMGKTITYCGPSGAGQLTKLTNQILVAGALLSVAEAMAFARASGLDERSALDAVVGGAAGSWQLANLAPKMLAGDWSPGFMIDLVLKDLRLVLDAAHDYSLPLPTIELAQRLFAKAQSLGHGRHGTQAVITAIDPTRWR